MYFVVPLEGGDICLVFFFPRHGYLAPQIGELIVYLIEYEEEEEPKNKQILSEPRIIIDFSRSMGYSIRDNVSCDSPPGDYLLKLGQRTS